MFTETPSRAAAASSSVFSRSGSRSVSLAALGSSAAAGWADGVLVDEDDARVATRQPELQVSGRKLCVRLEQRLAQQILKAQRRRASCGLGQAAAELGCPLVAERGRRLEVGAKRIDVW